MYVSAAKITRRIIWREREKDSENRQHFSCCKSYAKKIIKTIRQKDKKAIIVVGTPTWSQLGSDGTHNEVADSPIKGYKNIMYSLHFKEKRTAGHGD